MKPIQTLGWGMAGMIGVGFLAGASLRSNPTQLNIANPLHWGAFIGNETMGITERGMVGFQGQTLVESGMLAVPNDPNTNIETCAPWDSGCLQRQAQRDAMERQRQLLEQYQQPENERWWIDPRRYLNNGQPQVGQGSYIPVNGEQ